ncbi:Spo0E family sporulation regulatory protein-aspartic acid phosphatase [Paenibacillus apiarius]|uniref:Spo0E family sporulation regulatory protein-aspartic acid phosphatase n=1 Tax=Paenibacillus apiarius TaxID=46240 RepID=UPI00197E3C72|nr:aspartyl-phosphate phosphatase Spo0E family protein [Paenibacillus apiarius]
MVPFHNSLDDELTEKIQNLRQQLVKAVNQKKGFTDSEVIMISQELDVYILESQKKRYVSKEL